MEFRRISSNLLTSNYDNVNVNLTRFKRFIDEKQFINKLLHKEIDNIEYDFRTCFHFDGPDWNFMEIPIDERMHIRAQYDYITYIIEYDNCNVVRHALSYPHSQNNVNQMIQNFVREAFKPLIDFLVDAITKEMIKAEEYKTHTAAMVQNIGNVYGTAIQGNPGTSINTTNLTENEKLLELLSLAMQNINQFDAPEDLKKNFKDDLEIITEQINSQAPKKSRITKALEGMKKFISEFEMKIAVSVAANGVAEFDWSALIQYIEKYASNLIA